MKSLGKFFSDPRVNIWVAPILLSLLVLGAAFMVTR